MTADNVCTVFGVTDTIKLNETSVVEVDVFAALFSAASESPTYDELVAIDGGIMGYKPFFDQCKENGLLN
jgi:hypothetical protein